jgi:hypothetical protein
MNNAVERAKEVGTLNQVDRSRQYTRPENPELLRSLNEAWTKIRLLENGRRQDGRIIDALQGRLKRYKVVNIALTSILTGLAWEGLKLIVPALLRWLGIV